jgi:tubulin--tyrosine ligase
MKNLSNRMIHLTNDAVQKKCEDYGKFEPGNKLSFSDFQRYLDTNFNNVENGMKLKFWQQAYP